MAQRLPDPHTPSLPRGTNGQHLMMENNMANRSSEESLSTSHTNPDPSLLLDSESQENSTSSKASHQCSLCSRVYERADHLNRHLKTHENARPYKCTQCSKRFNRADLLSRHEANHGRVPGKRGEETDRVAVACRACVASKCKCQDEKPCVRCRTKGITCEIGPALGRGEPPKKQHRQSFTKSHDSNSYDNNQSIPSLTEDDESLSNQNQASMSPERDKSDSMHHDLGFVHNNSGSTQLPYHPIQHLTGGVFPATNNPYGTMGLGPLIQDNAPQLYNQPFQVYSSVPGDFQFNQGLGLVPRDSYFGQDLDFDMWDMNHEDFELHLPMEISSPAKQPQDRNPELANGHAHKRFAAFERSPWLWKPTSNDHTLNDQSDLNVDAEGVSLASAPSTPGTQMEQFSACCIDSKTRDRILHLLFNLKVPQTSVTSFPPLNLLNIVIQVYFGQCRFNDDHLIHAASFKPQTVSPELLVAIISAGATALSVPAIWRMGLVLQEYVRHTVAELWERNNSATRNLQSIQAWVIGLEVGLWSGIKRKMEIAESVCQPAIIMMRRAGVFSMGNLSANMIPSTNDSDTVLEAKWRNFIERESFKRLALRTFIHDIQASVGFQKPPQISFTELGFDLPVARELWLANSALQWRDVYLGKQWVNLPTFIEAVHDPDVLVRVSSLIDTKLCAMVIIGGYWGQIWRLMEAKKFYPSTKATYRLSMMTEQEELYRSLVAGASIVSSLCNKEATIDLFGEFLLMVSHISPENIQRFAGKFGAEDSAKAFQTFQTWFHTPESRMAIWHAGQVLRAAKRLPASQLKDFNAVAVYFASLTLWIYGIMLLAKEESHPESIVNTLLTDRTSDPSSHIFLNEPETIFVNKFFTGNQGRPGLAVADEEQSIHFVPLTSTARVLEFARSLYKSNFPHTNEVLPPLLESLGNLMKELSSLPGSRPSGMVAEAAL